MESWADSRAAPLARGGGVWEGSRVATAQTTSQVPTGLSNKELVLWTVQKINEQDYDAFSSAYAPDMRERFPDADLTGPEAIVAYFKDVFAAVSDLKLEILAAAEDGEHVFIRYVITGRHTGTFTGIAATGREIRLDGMDNFVVRDGKLRSNFVIFDRMQIAQQMGIMPPDDSRQDRAMKALFNAKTKVASKLRR
jgi:steroid delta-isomerase-like uncharacterized protein